MTDRDREINALAGLLKEADDGLFYTYEQEAEWLIENGVIVPPVEVGDTVWYVDDFTEEIEECKVYGFNVVNGKLSLLVDNGECKFITRKWHNTKEKAEAEQRKRSEDNG